MIRVVCGCGRVFKAEERHSGKRTRCPVCGTGLIIGRAPSSGSSEVDIGEVPSWWYPTDSPGTIGTQPVPRRAGGDPDAIPTVVLETGPGLDLRGGLRDGERRPGPAASRDGRSIRPFAGVVATTAGLVLGAIAWMFWISFPVAPTAPRGPRAAATPHDGARSPLAAADRKDADRDRGTEPARTARPKRRLHLLVPAYIYPTKEGQAHWQRLFDAAAKVDLVAVVNPDTGPGPVRNPDYAALIAEAADRGVKLIGYVTTHYADRLPSEVKADVDTWVRHYPRIAGFFFDQQPPDARQASYMADIAAYARGKLKDPLIISNPGALCDESYLSRRGPDTVSVFDNSDGFGSFQLPAHLKEYDPSRYAAVVYQVADAAAMREMVKDAIIKRIGWIYITDGKLPNPWGQLPSYWEAEVDAVRAVQ